MTTKSTPKDLIDSFPHSKLTPIATATTEPDYLSLHQLQYEINDNAETLSSTLGDGQHGHLFLVISETEYLEMTDGVPCIPPVQPPFDPVHAANATAPQIIEANHQNDKRQKLFDLYHNAIKINSLKPFPLNTLNLSVILHEALTKSLPSKSSLISGKILVKFRLRISSLTTNA
jgi:hypothetical protein